MIYWHYYYYLECPKRKKLSSLCRRAPDAKDSLFLFLSLSAQQDDREMLARVRGSAPRTTVAPLLVLAVVTVVITECPHARMSACGNDLSVQMQNIEKHMNSKLHVHPKQFNESNHQELFKTCGGNTLIG